MLLLFINKYLTIKYLHFYYYLINIIKIINTNLSNLYKLSIYKNQNIVIFSIF